MKATEAQRSIPSAIPTIPEPVTQPPHSHCGNQKPYRKRALEKKKFRNLQQGISRERGQVKKLREVDNANKLRVKEMSKDQKTAEFQINRLEGKVEALTIKLAETKDSHHEHIKALISSRQEVAQRKRATEKKLDRALTKRGKWEKDCQKRIAEKLSQFRLKEKGGAYTSQARDLAFYLTTVSVPEAKVGEAIQELGGFMGREVRERMSARTVQRATQEYGDAADLQLAHEMAGSKGDKIYFTYPISESKIPIFNRDCLQL